MLASQSHVANLIQQGDMALSEEKAKAALERYLFAGTHVIRENWRLPVRRKIRALTLEDIDGDGQDEIIFGTEGHSLVILDLDGNELSRFEAHDWINGIAILDINDDGEKEIIIGADKLYVLDSSANILENHEVTSAISSLAVGVLAKSKKIAIVTGDRMGNITCYSPNFQQLWVYSTQGDVVDLAIGDIDGDDKTEIIAASEDKHVYVLAETGEKKDIMPVSHWIINMDICCLKDKKNRLFVGEFGGTVHIYKHHKEKNSTSVLLKQQGILDLRVAYLLEGTSEPQFVVGTSEKVMTILSNEGVPIWKFETGLGQRALHIKKTNDGEILFYVGTESGEIISYTVLLMPTLAEKIRKAFELCGESDIYNLSLPSNMISILRNYVSYDPINRAASLRNSRLYIEKKRTQKAISISMEIWWNGIEYLWSHQTAGRIYALDAYTMHSPKEGVLLAGSEDCGLYCLNLQSGAPVWDFRAKGGVRGIATSLRGGASEEMQIAVASADGSVYMLDACGRPLWNYQHNVWMLYVAAGGVGTTAEIKIIVGTEDKMVLAFDFEGKLLWKRTVGKRVRALTISRLNEDGQQYVIAGSDDNFVYVLNEKGHVIDRFVTPHYVLTVHACDLYQDGKVAILTGNEDGFLHVYNTSGELLWRFETGSWIAALDTYVNKATGQIEIIIGSADNHLYGLDVNGAILWQYEAAARVRSLHIVQNPETGHEQIAFGSYDNGVYLIEEASVDTAENILSEIFSKECDAIAKSNNVRLENTARQQPQRHLRAFACLFSRDDSFLKDSINDNSAMVWTAVACNIIRNYLPDEPMYDLVKQALLLDNRKASIRIYQKIREAIRGGRFSKTQIMPLMEEVLKHPLCLSNKIDAFRQICSMGFSGLEILSLANVFFKHDDEYAVDELNHACQIAFQIGLGDGIQPTFKQKAIMVAEKISSKYPNTSMKLLNAIERFSLNVRN